jgi:hypothetical protein
MGLRGRIRRLKQSAREEMVEVSQRDGTVERFPQSAGAEALVSLIGGRDHPLAMAARNSSAPEWTNSFYNSFPLDPDAEDLSET